MTAPSTQRRLPDAEAELTPEEREERKELADKLKALSEASGAGGGRAEILRKLPGKSRPQYEGQVALDDLVRDPYELVRELYGGGDFQITVRDRNGDYQKGGSFQLSIAGAPKSKADKLEELERKLEEAQRADRAADPMTALLLQTMLEQIREGRKGDGGANVAEIITAVGAIAAPVITALLNRPQPEPTDPLEQVHRLAEVMQVLQGMNGGNRSALERAVDNLSGPLGQFFSSASSTAGAAGLLPRPNPPNGAEPMAKKFPDGAPEWWPLVERVVPQLLRWAANGNDAELRADLVLEEVPDDYLPVLHAQLQRGDEFRAEFFRMVPAAQEHREWFVDFFDRMHVELDAMWVPLEDELEEGELEERDAAELGTQEGTDGAQEEEEAAADSA